MKKLFFPLLMGVLFFCTSVQGKSIPVLRTVAKDAIVSREINQHAAPSEYAPSDSLYVIAKDTVRHKKHRLIAAVLAFPVIGIFGLHRVYLGTAPHIPFIYIATLGGGLGILPFIDFVMILLSRDKEFHTKYTHNHYLFMWHKK